VVKRGITRGALSGPNVKIDSGGEYALAEFDMKSVMDGPEGPGSKADFKLEPFDVVTVSPALVGRYVHITGEVTRPGNIELVTQDSVSLMKLIAVAGGLSRTAAPNKTVIMHVTAEGVQTSTSVVDVKKIMEGKSKDLDLTAGDIVLVPSSKAKTLSAMLTSTAITAGLTTAIYTLGRY
jgi:protein involved in polysaccharide export with SLBB domain